MWFILSMPRILGYIKKYNIFIQKKWTVIHS